MRTNKIVVIDGQGGSIGKALVEQLKKEFPNLVVTAIGTNSIATSVMLKAGADFGATGENAAVVACEDAALIIGPIGIVSANSLLGEVTPAMAVAIGKSHAEKVLIPVKKCKLTVAGNKDLSLSELISQAVSIVSSLLLEDDSNIV